MNLILWLKCTIERITVSPNEWMSNLWVVRDKATYSIQHPPIITSQEQLAINGLIMNVDNKTHHISNSNCFLFLLLHIECAYKLLISSVNRDNYIHIFIWSRQYWFGKPDEAFHLYQLCVGNHCHWLMLSFPHHV